MMTDRPASQGANDFEPLADAALSRWADQPGGPGPCPQGLDDLVAGRLDARLASELRAHLLGCPACYQEVAGRHEAGEREAVALGRWAVSGERSRAKVQADLAPAMPALVQRWVDLVVTLETRQRESASLVGVRRTLELLERRRWRQAVAEAQVLARQGPGVGPQATVMAGRVLRAAALLGAGEWLGAVSAFDGLLTQGGGDRQPLLEVGQALASAGASGESRPADLGALRQRLEVLARSLGRGPGRGLD